MDHDPILKDVLCRLKLKCKEDVYEPREDSFLFLDALESDKEFLVSRDPFICLEIGPGSGIISTFVSSLFCAKEMIFFGCDVNEHACHFTMETFSNCAASAKHSMHCVRGDLASCLEGKLEKQVDLLLFNPPYVPTEEEEVGHADIRAAWAGGSTGMDVTSRFLPSVTNLLSEKGCFYLVCVEENNPIEIAKELNKKYNLIPKRIAKRKAKNESLSIWRYTRKET